MGQRHNRRRTRPRSSQRTNFKGNSLPNQISTSPLPVSSIWSPESCLVQSPVPSYSTVCISRGSPGPVPAPTWHNGYTAWKIREATPRLATGGLEDEQYRLFGGEPGDDVSLCYRMLEYFGGLDYIDSARPSTLGD
ncbi:hypothetical protein N7528_008247 [Penicillium herquei]|nr:hypothetical protein N7528_008247 [Penicillium herquei]